MSYLILKIAFPFCHINPHLAHIFVCIQCVFTLCIHIVTVSKPLIGNLQAAKKFESHRRSAFEKLQCCQLQKVYILFHGNAVI